MGKTSMQLKDEDILQMTIAGADAFRRADERDDKIFYDKPRMVEHLDAGAGETVRKLLEGLIVEENPRILDLMAATNSHLPIGLEAHEVIGLGLNEKELKENAVLSEYIIHDLNETPKLPLPDTTFDAVINTVSVDYMTKPVDVFRDVGRILKPGGLCLV